MSRYDVVRSVIGQDVSIMVLRMVIGIGWKTYKCIQFPNCTEPLVNMGKMVFFPFCKFFNKEYVKQEQAVEQQVHNFASADIEQIQ